MNTSFPPHARPQHPRGRGTIGAKEAADGVEHMIDHDWVNSNIERSVKVREQLAILSGRRASGDNTQLAPR
jgi:hypothetical protein